MHSCLLEETEWRLKSTIAIKDIFTVQQFLKMFTEDMELAQEETFGPVAPILTVEDEKQAIEVANNTKFGLGASIWTQDLDKAEKYSRAVQVRHCNCK